MLSSEGLLDNFLDDNFLVDNSFDNNEMDFATGNQGIGQYIPGPWPNAMQHAPPVPFIENSYLVSQDARLDTQRPKVASESSGYGTMSSNQDGGSGEVDNQYNVSGSPYLTHESPSHRLRNGDGGSEDVEPWDPFLDGQQMGRIPDSQ